jgi:hypothetical protein
MQILDRWGCENGGGNAVTIRQPDKAIRRVTPTRRLARYITQRLRSSGLDWIRSIFCAETQIDSAVAAALTIQGSRP